MNKIQTFIINLENRADRKEHILNEFIDREEFDITFVVPEKHLSPKVSLWNTIKSIVQGRIDFEDDFIVICEDDHQFTIHYNKEILLKCISLANDVEADILSGGVSGLQHFVGVNSELLWMGNFSGLQFTVIFRRFFKKITAATFTEADFADLKLSLLTENKFVIYPFISVQKEFGYSDVTPLNNNKGRVDKFFDWTTNNIEFLISVSAFYKNLKKQAPSVGSYTCQNIYIPTYIINLPERTDRLEHIKNQFTGRNEFDIEVIKAVKHSKGNLGLWLTIRKIIESAIFNNHDLIVICEDDHEFTDNYKNDEFIKNVIDAHLLGAGLLVGGISQCGAVTPISDTLLWVDRFFCTQFIVIYKSLFQKILDEPYDENTTADGAFSQITSNKLVNFPFISTQKYLGESDISPSVFKEGQVERMFASTSARLSQLINAQKKYSV